MNLRIPQTNIGSEITLGILGTHFVELEEISKGCQYDETRVDFILRANEWAATHNFPWAFYKIMGTHLTVHNGFAGYDSVMLFSLTVEGHLRNPQAFLKATARKINKLWLELDAAEEAERSRAEWDQREGYEWSQREVYM